MKFIDLVLYHERSITSREPLLKRHANSLGYLACLPPSYSAVAIQGAAFEETFVRGNIEYLITPGCKHALSVPCRLFLAIRAMRPDVVLVHGFSFAWQILWLRRFLPVRARLLVQNQAEQPFPGLKRNFQRWVAPKVEGFLFVNREQAAPWFTKGIFPHGKRIFEVMEGSTNFNLRNKEECRRQLKLPSGPIFLWVGRLDPNKDPMTMLRAFVQFRSSCPTFRLYMIYNSEKLKAVAVEFIRANNLTDNIELIGEVENADLEVWYNAVDCFILGSHYEGSGYALCEALACGCFPIVTNIPSFRKMTDNGRLGMLFEPGNAGQLAEHLTRTLDLRLDEKRAAIREFFEKELSYAAIAKKIDAACREVLTR